MAQVVLTAVGSAVGGPVGAAIGGTVGAMLDRAAVESLRPAREVGPRSLHVMSAAEGAPVPAVFGRTRVAGQVIWAARFRANRTEAREGGKTGPRTATEAYTLSFAVAVGEGPIDGVGRIWADGKPMDLNGVTVRTHLGGEDQEPDPLITVVEGEAPAYRGTAYLVFEDLPLGAYGNRVPQLSVEVFRRPRGSGPGLEEQLEGVCLIPGAGEFVLADRAVLRREGLTRARAENVNNAQGRPDLMVSLDQLQAQLPAVKAVTLVVSWFGDDLRAGECQVRPGVEIGAKDTLPIAWSAGGVDRGGARLLAGEDGRPRYGGTPADATVVAAIRELKRRGYQVTLYPFLMMDIAPGNGRPDPYGEGEQAAFPWRGRITCHPAPGRPGSPDQTAAAAAQVERFFGWSSADQFDVVDGEVRYAGSEWTWSRAVLHYAKLAEAAGGVDGFLIGAELRGLTWVRSEPNSYPAVASLRRLAGECRTVLGGGTALSYAADWSEWFGHQPPDGSGHVSFHLDPLWSDPAVSFVGIDWYPPITDWRDGTEHRDAQAGFEAPHDPAYLAKRVMGGEGFDWFYASEADRAAQVRTPITDGAHGEPWAFRPKDIRSWWTHVHHDRPGGTRSAVSTGWIPRSKPVRLVEFGCPAVDKGANSPNLFHDPKSSEGGFPPYSNGGRDDLGQRRALEAVLAHFADPQNNPPSDLYDGPMVDGLSAWCWDARPFPDFPGRADVWADAANWTYGHWLTGRAGVAPAAELLAAVMARAGVGAADLELSAARGSVTGYVVDRPMSLREAVAPLLEVFGLDLAERNGRLTAVPRAAGHVAQLALDDLAWPEEAAAPERRVRAVQERAAGARVRFIDDAGEYQLGSAAVTGSDPGKAGVLDLDLPVVAGRSLAEQVGRRRLARQAASADETSVHLSPEALLRIEPGDHVRLGGSTDVWRVNSVETDERPRALLSRLEDEHPDTGSTDPEWRPGPPGEPPAPLHLRLLDLPALQGAEERVVLAAVAGEPWRGAEIAAGPAAAVLRRRARADRPAGVGLTLTALERATPDRLHRAGRLTVRMEGVELRSRTWPEVAGGANALAVGTPGHGWEVLQFLRARLVAPETYLLTGLLRGQAGADGDLEIASSAGSGVVALDGGLVRVEMTPSERDLPLVWRATADGSVDDLSTTDATFVWRDLASRPWSPAHLRGCRLSDGSLRLRWVRRARVGGDTWTGEPPLAEEAEVYRVEVQTGSGTVRAWKVAEAQALYTVEQMAEDFPGDRPAFVTVRVRQGSTSFGWGAPATKALWL